MLDMKTVKLVLNQLEIVKQSLIKVNLMKRFIETKMSEKSS